MEYNQSLPVFLLSACRKSREREGKIDQEPRKTQNLTLKGTLLSITAPAAKPGIHFAIRHTVVARTKCCRPLNTAADWLMAGGKQKCWLQRLSAIFTGVRAPVTGSQGCPDGRGEFYFIFFQITGTGWHTPPVVVVPKAINHLKMDMVESFPLWGGRLIKTRQMEKERGERLFSTVSQRCLNPNHSHIQNLSGDSYHRWPEFKSSSVEA